MPACATCRVAAITWCASSWSATSASSLSPATALHGAGLWAACSRPGVRQLVDPLARLGRGLADEVLVLELLERRVDGPGARPPDASGSLGELLDDLVAVHGLLGEQREDRGADVAAPCAPAEGVARAVVAVAPPAVAAAAHERMPSWMRYGRPPIANAVPCISFVSLAYRDIS